jgi:hypothetical protein
MSADHVSDKGSVSRIWGKKPNLLQFKNTKTDNPILKVAKDLNTHFSEDTEMVDKHMKRCLP